MSLANRPGSRKLFLLSALTILILSSPAFAANKYWVGGSGNWSDGANHWSGSSGGAPGAGHKPDSGDRAIFDSNSGGGTCAVDEAVDVRGFEMRTGNTTAVSQGTNTITIGNQDMTLTAGTFTGGSASIDVNGTFTLEGASFTSTSGTLFCGDDFTVTSGTFTHNSGSVEFDTRNLDITPASIIFNDVTLTDNGRFVLIGTMNVNGTLTLDEREINGGTINARGNIVIGSGFNGGTTTVTLTVAGNQSITSSGGQMPDTLTINKASGTVTVSGDTTFTSVNLQDGTLTFQGGSTYTFVTSGSGIVTSSDTDLDFQGSSGNLVTLDRSGGGSWILNVHSEGNYTADYVDAARSNATGQVIYATNSVDSGNNTNWVFGDKLVFATAEQTISVNTVSAVMTVQIQNADGTPQAAAEDITIDLSTTSGGGEFSLASVPFVGTTSVTITTGADSVSFYYRDSQAGSPVITAWEDPERGWEDAVQTETITSDTASFTVTASTPQVAGSPFILTITARDASGDPDTGYSGTADLNIDYITPSGGTYSIDPASTSDFTDGVAIISATYDDCGTVTVTATDASEPTITGTSPAISFRPFDFLLESSALDAAGRHMVKKPFVLSVTARSASGVTCPNYLGTAGLSVNYVSPPTDQAGALTTSALVADKWASGIATIEDMAYDKWGTISISATDAELVTQSGTSGNILFIPRSLSVHLAGPPASRTYYYINEELPLTVTAEDYLGGEISNYQGTVSFVGRDLDLPDRYTFTPQDAGSHEFTEVKGLTETETELSVRDTAYDGVIGTSGTIALKEGTIRVISTSGPVGTVNVGVMILDKDGEVLTEDDSTTFTVELEESITDNGSATSSAEVSPARITEGASTITVTDTEAETVEVAPLSRPYLVPESGTVRFGTVSGTGVGVELWREIREPAEYEEE